MLNSFRLENFSIIWRYFYLEKFIRSKISSDYLNNMQEDFNKIRKSGIKVIVRFAYSDNPNAIGSLDANVTQVLEHISQLKPLLINNADVIMVVQAGFIGAWGEWYFTDNFGFPTGWRPNSKPTSTDYLNRKLVIDALLNALPLARKIQLRTPAHKINFDLNFKTPLSYSEALTATNKARIGQHNDCFLASRDDFGTYSNLTVDYPWLAQETLYLPMGGETCAVNLPRSGCKTALIELEKFHWTYLNIEYHPDVINTFRTEGCFETIQNRLGYRFELISGIFPKIASKQSLIKIEFQIKNKGFSALINPRKAYLVFRSKFTEYSIALKTNLNFWLANSLNTISETIKLPETLPIGEYKLFLNLPDSYESIRNKREYSIRLANNGLWEGTTGFNNLLHTININ
jgi:hypothetical protein